MYLANHWRKPTVSLAYTKLHCVCPMILNYFAFTLADGKKEYLIHKKDFKSLSMVTAYLEHPSLTMIFLWYLHKISTKRVYVSAWLTFWGKKINLFNKYQIIYIDIRLKFYAFKHFHPQVLPPFYYVLILCLKLILNEFSLCKNVSLFLLHQHT